MAESIGTFDRLYISADDSTYLAYEFQDGSSIGLSEQFVDPNGLRGTTQHDSRRVRRGLRQVQGQLNFQPNPVELDTLLPWILGADESANTFNLAETVPARYVRTSRDGTYHLYNGVKVAQATFNCSEGSPLSLSVSVQGVDEATSTAPTGPPTIDDANGPWMMTDCVLSVGGSNYAFREFSLSVDNVLETRFNNTITPSSIHKTDFNCSVSLGLPYGDASALYGSALAGVAVVATFTNAITTGRTLVFTLNDVAAPKQPLPLGGRTARTMQWVGVARRDASNNALVVSNVSS